MYVYIHLPFCSSICSYCDFPKVYYDKKYIFQYLECLRQEILERYCSEKVLSIYIGGGTPTCLELEEFELLLQLTLLFHKEKKIEFTVESNVENLTLDKIKLMKKYGVNRVSLGVQSFQENILLELNRHHTKEDVFHVVNLLKSEGITNISIDYIYGISTSLKVIEDDMNTFLKLDIPHISCYSLIIENNTVLKIRGKLPIHDELDKKMYDKIESCLINREYQHYEISNYGKKGFFSLHNLNYWSNGEYYGFGLGAVSFINNVRRVNTKSLSCYLKRDYLYIEEYEDVEIKMSNEFILGFRKLEGISIKDFEMKYHINIIDFRNVKKLLNDGLLEIVDGNLRIPLRYIYQSNSILVYFV